MHLATHVTRDEQQSSSFFDSLRDLFGRGPRYTGDQPQDLSPQLMDWGVPEQDAQHYAEAVRRGSTLILVDTPDDRMDVAHQIMDSHHPLDIDERAEGWRQQGWRGYDKTSRPFTKEERQRERTRYAQDMNKEGTTTIPVTEERLRAGKREVQRGGARIYTRVKEQPAEETVNLRDETVNVDRRKVDRPASREDLDAFKEGTFEVTETDEEAVVDKDAHVVEEVTVKKDVQERPETIRDTVRRTEVDTEDIGTGRQGRTDFETYEPQFRNHYKSTYSNTGYDYDQFQPAYRYGYDMAKSGRYKGRDWNAIQRDLRNSWEQDHTDMSWDEYQGAIREGWQQGVSNYS